MNPENDESKQKLIKCINNMICSKCQKEMSVALKFNFMLYFG